MHGFSRIFSWQNVCFVSQAIFVHMVVCLWHLSLTFVSDRSSLCSYKTIRKSIWLKTSIVLWGNIGTEIPENKHHSLGFFLYLICCFMMKFIIYHHCHLEWHWWWKIKQLFNLSTINSFFPARQCFIVLRSEPIMQYF